MDQPRIRAGAPVPLFDRLVDQEPMRPSEPRPFRVLDAEGLRASVRRDLARLLDTRRPIGPLAALAETELTVLEYGIADVTTLSPRSIDDRRLLGLVIEKAVRAFEPRLRNCSATVEPIAANQQNVAVRLSGVLAIGDIVERFSFAVVLNVKSQERLEAHAAS